jgi:phage terminase large subunit
MTDDLAEAARLHVDTYGNDLAGYVRAVMGLHVISYQQKFLDAVSKHPLITWRSGHGVGKSRSMAMAALSYLYTHPSSFVVTTAPTNRQVRNVLWREIRSLHSQCFKHLGAYAEPNLTELWMDEEREWGAIGFSTDDPSQMQGIHARDILVLVDEAAGMDDELMDSLLSLATGAHGCLAMVGNPTRIGGMFYNSFRTEGWYRLHTSCYDSPRITGEKCPKTVLDKLVGMEYVEMALREWGEDSPVFQARVQGEFPTEGDDTLIPLRWVEDAVQRVEERIGPFTHSLGVDVARFGSDKTVMCVIDGKTANIVRVLQGRDTTEIAGHVKQLSNEWRFEGRIAIDDDGVGGGVTDRLREDGFNVMPINSGAKAFQEGRYYNRRAELWWEARKWIENDAILPDEGSLIADLTAPKYKVVPRGIQVEPKAETKKRLGRSPDYADALIYALAAGMGSPDWSLEDNWDYATPLTAGLMERSL